MRILSIPLEKREVESVCLGQIHPHIAFLQGGIRIQSFKVEIFSEALLPYAALSLPSRTSRSSFPPLLALPINARMAQQLRRIHDL
jgi:hypothetical protein